MGGWSGRGSQKERKEGLEAHLVFIESDPVASISNRIQGTIFTGKLQSSEQGPGHQTNHYTIVTTCQGVLLVPGQVTVSCKLNVCY